MPRPRASTERPRRSPEGDRPRAPKERGLKAEVASIEEDPLAHAGGALADFGPEDEGVEPAERGRHRGDGGRDPMSTKDLDEAPCDVLVVR